MRKFRGWNSWVSKQYNPVGITEALDGLMTDCGCNLVSMTADADKLSLVIDNGGKLKAKALNIPGYQTSITLQPNRGAESIVLTLISSAGKWSTASFVNAENSPVCFHIPT